MLIDLIFAIGGLFGFFLIGAGWLKCANNENSPFTLIFAILAGLATVVVAGAWTVALRVNPTWLLLPSFSVGIAGWLFQGGGIKVTVHSMWLSIRRLGSTLFSLPLIFSFVSPLVYIALQNRFLLRGTIAFRNGPDFVGWTSAGQYLCKYDTLRPLEQRLASQLGTTHILNGFLPPQKIGQNSVIAIPSFTDQINGEFLIGAHRTGLPGVAASVCKLFGEEAIYHANVALLAIAVFVISALVALTAIDLKISPTIRNLAILSVAINPCLLAVTMEGGFGQLIAIPFLLAVVVCTHERKELNKYLPIVIAMLISYSLATYLDLLIFASGLGFLFLCMMLIRLEFFWHEWPVNKIFFFSLVSIGVGWPEFSSFMRLVRERVGAQNFGGWDQGRNPTPADVMGILNWLPFDGAHNTPRGSGLLIFALLLSGFLVVVFARVNSPYMKSIFGGFMIYYSYFMYTTYISSHNYVNGQRVFNNYTIFKFSAYFSVIIPLLIFYALSQPSEDKNASKYPNVAKLRPPINRSLQILLLSVLSISLASGYEWSKDWVLGRHFAFSVNTQQKMRNVIDSYDISVEEYTGVEAQAFALLGDVHFLSPTRGYQLVTKRSIPSRQLVFAVPTITCESNVCRTTPSPEGFEKILVTSEVTVYRRKG